MTPLLLVLWQNVVSLCCVLARQQQQQQQQQQQHSTVGLCICLIPLEVEKKSRLDNLSLPLFLLIPMHRFDHHPLAKQQSVDVSQYS